VHLLAMPKTAEAWSLTSMRESRRIARRGDRVIGRQLPAGEIGRTLKTMLDAEMAP
jgi:hypothetical protein